MLYEVITQRAAQRVERLRRALPDVDRVRDGGRVVERRRLDRARVQLGRRVEVGADLFAQREDPPQQALAEQRVV